LHFLAGTSVSPAVKNGKGWTKEADDLHVKRSAREIEIAVAASSLELGPHIYAANKVAHTVSGRTYTIHETMVEPYENSLDFFLCRASIIEKETLETVAHQLVCLCVRVARAGYCLVDIKPGNIIIGRAKCPTEVRLIDYDPRFCRTFQKDSKIINILAQKNEGLQAAWVQLREFYVAIMLTFLSLHLRSISVREPAIAKNIRYIRQYIRMALQSTSGSFNEFFNLNIRREPLLLLLNEVMIHYVLIGKDYTQEVSRCIVVTEAAREKLRSLKARYIDVDNKEVAASQKIFREAATRLEHMRLLHARVVLSETDSLHYLEFRLGADATVKRHTLFSNAEELQIYPEGYKSIYGLEAREWSPPPRVPSISKPFVDEAKKDQLLRLDVYTRGAYLALNSSYAYKRISSRDQVSRDALGKLLATPVRDITERIDTVRKALEDFLRSLTPGNMRDATQAVRKEWSDAWKVESETIRKNIGERFAEAREAKEKQSY
jgi:hypothetical protein